MSLETKSIVQAFEQVVDRYPSRPAVCDDERTLTFSELNNASNKLGYELLERLDQGSELVAYLLGQKVNSLQTIWGILKCGKGFVVLDPSFASEKLREILLDSDTRILITDNAYLSLAQSLTANTSVAILNVDNIETKKTNNLDLEIAPTAFAVALYTSGSTGKPKAFVRTFQSMLYRHPYNPEFKETDRAMLPGLAGFSQNQYTLYTTLMSGGCLFLYNARENDPRNLFAWVDRNKITIIVSTPSLFRAGFESAPEGKVFSSVRSITLGGEASVKQDFELFKRCFLPGTKGTVDLGSTEVGLISKFDFDHNTKIDSAIIPVGRVIPSKKVFLLDENGKEVAQGEVGEIVVNAKAFSTQYWKNPDLADEKIKPDPNDSSMSLFFSGDLGRFRPDGMLEHHGRKDSMVKINGQRVDTNEIEALIKEHPQIAGVAVRAIPNRADEARLQLAVYYVVKNAEDRLVTPSSVRSYMHERLPNMLIAAQFVKVESIPLNANGKTDYKKLAEIVSTQQIEETTFEEPADKIEERLSLIWQNLFKKTKIGVTENFFDLGGDSLLAMQLLTEIEKFFDMRLPLSVISKASNIRQQAEILKKPDVISFASVIIPIRANGEKPPLFFFAGKGGNPIRFHSLIKRLPEDRPIYFFRSRGFEEGEKIEITIEEIAADYLKEIKRIQPVGPYHFLGESGGGMVAFEMAQQLLNQDELTHFVIMFDSYLEEIALGKINKFVKNLRLIRKHAQTILSGGIKDYSRYYFELIQYNRKIKAEKIKIKNALGINNNQRDYEKIEKANMLAGAKYIPRPYSGKVVMFSAMRQVQLQGTRADHGWGDVGIEKLIVIPVDCYHGNILFEPFVESISMKINELLVQ